MPSMRSRAVRLPTALVPILAIGLAACAGLSGGTGSDGPLPPGGVTTPRPAAGTASRALSPSIAAESGVAGESAPADRPPAARLAAEGGDPVTGQLGTFIWGDGGSDSPWLQGAPIHVGAGERLSLVLSPSTGIRSWRARSVRAGATAPIGATLLGSGTDKVLLTAPARGRWTVELAIDFAGTLGAASYFWRLEVE